MGAIFTFKHSRTLLLYNRTLFRPIFSDFTPKRNLKMSFLSLNSFTPHSPSKDRGRIQVIFGPMFSGKSTELLRRIRRYKIAKRECLVIKYSKDDRFSEDCMATHDQQLIPAVKATKLFDLKCLDKYSVIGVDEGQFFPDVVEFSEEMANQGKTVIVAALDGTFERKAFGRILELVPIAESVVKLNAVCNNCFHEAAYTKRIGQETEIEVIGGSDKYMAMCRQCFQLSPSKITSKVDKVVRSPFKNLSNRENIAVSKVVKKVF